MPKPFICLFWIALPIVIWGQGLEKGTANSTLNYARAITATLCSQEYDGRGYVNEGCRKAGTFILEEFKRLGLKPYQEQYLQPFSLNVNTFPDKCVVKNGLRKKKPGVDFLIHPSSAGYQGTLRLQWVTASGIMQYRFGSQTSSRQGIAFVAPKDLGKDSLKMVRTKLEKIAQSDCPVLEYTGEKLTWSVAQQRFKHPYLQCYDTLHRRQITKVKLHIDAEFQTQYEVKNCFGFVPSLNPSDSLIVVSAHYDHLGRMGEKTYFPGANDNASGVAMLLSIAREIQQNPLPNHSVLFIAFAGEEAGLVGSYALVASELIDLNNISLVLNLDILGSGEEGITVVNGSVFPQYYQRLVQLNESIPAVPVIKSRGKAANSDHHPFSEKGVPSLFVYTMGPNKNYHDINDRYEHLSFDRFEALHHLFIRFLQRF